MAKFEITLAASLTVEAEGANRDEAEKAALANNPTLDEVEVTDAGEIDYDMTEQEIVADFEENILPAVIAQYGNNDRAAKSEAFNNYTDSLCKDRQITTWQYEHIDNPY